MIFDTKAIREKDWDAVKEGFLTDGWQFRNQENPVNKEELDNGSRFWSSTGTANVMSGVIYIRKTMI